MDDDYKTDKDWIDDQFDSLFDDDEIDDLIKDMEYADNRIARLEDLLGRWRRAFRLQCGDNSPLLLDTNAEIGPNG